jgi:hypothetical protein
MDVDNNASPKASNRRNSPIPQKKAGHSNDGQVDDTRNDILDTVVTSLNQQEDASHHIDDQRAYKDQPEIVQVCHGNLQVTWWDLGLNIVINEGVD